MEDRLYEMWLCHQHELDSRIGGRPGPGSLLCDEGRGDRADESDGTLLRSGRREGELYLPRRCRHADGAGLFQQRVGSCACPGRDQLALRVTSDCHAARDRSNSCFPGIGCILVHNRRRARGGWGSDVNVLLKARRLPGRSPPLSPASPDGSPDSRCGL